MGNNTYIGGKEIVSQASRGTVFKPNDPVLLKPKGDPAVAPYANNSSSILNPAGTVKERNTLVATGQSALGAGQHAPVVMLTKKTANISQPFSFSSAFGKGFFIETFKTVRHFTEGLTSVIFVQFPAVPTMLKNMEGVASQLDADLLKEMGQSAADGAADSVKQLLTLDTLIQVAKDLALHGVAVVANVVPVAGQAASVAAGTVALARDAERATAIAQTAQQQLQEMKGLLNELATPNLSTTQQRDLAKRFAAWSGRGGADLVKALLLRRNGKSKSASNDNEKVKTTDKPSDPLPKSTCQCNIGKPVVIATGEKALNHLDFDLPGAIPLDWRRRYRSGDDRSDGWFGQGWSHPLAVELWLQADALLYFDAQGRAVRLPPVPTGAEHFEAYEQTTVARPTDNTWELRHTSGLTQVFHRHVEGQWRLSLQTIVDRNGNRTDLRFEAADFGSHFNPFAPPPRPSHVRTSAGTVLALHWTAQRQLQAVEFQPPGAAPVLLARYDYGPDGALGLAPGAANPPDLLSHTNAVGQTRHYSWDQHLLVGYTLASGHRHSNRYDTLLPSGRVTESLALDDGTGLRFSYQGVYTAVEDPLGRVTAYAHNARDDIVAVRDAEGNVTQTPFDANGHPSGSVDALGRRTSSSFDRRGNLTQLVDAGGNVTRIDYNALDLPIKLTDALGGAWLRSYDERGNLLASTDPLGQTTHYQVNARGQVVAIQDAAGRTKHLLWDEAGNLLAYTDCSGHTTGFAYDPLGRLQSTTDALGQTTHYRFDAQGRLLALRQPDGAQEHYTWDGEGNLLSATDALGQTTRWRYSGSGDPLERIDALGQRITYQFDAAGRLATLRNENGESTHFGYDRLDRLTDEIGFDGRHQRYCWNAAGELTHLVEQGGSDLGPGKVTRYERDTLGRLLAKRHDGEARPESCDAVYAYDPLGRLTSAGNAVATVAMAYDAIGQLLQETQHLRLPANLAGLHDGAPVQARQLDLHHRYDALGNRTATVLPDGRTLNHLFYGAGHLHQVNLDGQVVSDIERDALHREVRRSQGQLLSEYAYDPVGRLTAQRVRRAQVPGLPGVATGAATRPDQAAIDPHTGRPTRLSGLIERRYAYDAAGQLRQWLDRERGLTQYDYDPVGRIVGSRFGVPQPAVSAAVPSATAAPPPAAPGRSERFHWDAASNPVAPPAPGQPSRPVPGNRLLVWQDEAYRYDAHGNLTERLQGKRGSAAQTYTRLHWDGAHQLVQATVTRGAGPAATTQDVAYAYDALGRRVAKIDAFGTTAFAWDGDRMVLEQRGSHEVLHLYEPQSFVPLAQVHGGIVHHLHTDHLPESVTLIPA